MTFEPLIEKELYAPFGKVSVVIIARAADSNEYSLNFEFNSSILLIIFSCGNFSPITPVDAENIELSGIFISLEIDAQIFCTDTSPCVPVNAFELPELTIIAAAVLSDRFTNLFWQSNTLADRVLDRVNTPAIELPAAHSINITSSRSAYLIFAATDASRIPLIIGNFGNPFFGASGEISFAIYLCFSSESSTSS